MGGIRLYTQADATEVLALHARTMPAPTPASTDYHEVLYGKALFDNPWSDADLPSLVYEHRGAVAGFLGVVARPMTFAGRRIRAAVSVRFMVDPDSRVAPVAAAALHRRFLRGPQDLSLIENANVAARRVWEGTPGVVMVPLGSISWSATAVAAPAPSGADRALGAAELLDCIRSAAEPYTLKPVYDEQSVSWLLGFLDAARYRGTLRCRLVPDERGGTRGWFVYHGNPDGYNGVLALRSVPGGAHRTLDSLLRDAHLSGGATRTVGRLDPGILGAVADRGAELSPGPWTFAYSTDPRIALSLVAGDAFFTRLDGEFC